MPNCLCGHSAANHCWKKEAWGECWKCRCAEYRPNGYQPKHRHIYTPKVDNLYIRKLRYRRK
jgi:hypothetical protein